MSKRKWIQFPKATIKEETVSVDPSKVESIETNLEDVNKFDLWFISGMCCVIYWDGGLEALQTILS